jgi:hypothetical protein
VDPIEDALAWLFTKSEDEIVAAVEIAALYDMFLKWRVDHHRCQQENPLRLSCARSLASVSGAVRTIERRDR